MNEILHQLVGLLIASVPTAILFSVLVLAYRFIVFKPLLAMTAERRARTEGAVEKANAAITAADAKSQEYEARLRAARIEIFHGREQRMQQWNVERDRALESAHRSAHDHVQTARAAIDEQVGSAKTQIQSSIDQLAAQILKVILPVAAGNPAQGRVPVEVPVEQQHQYSTTKPSL